MVLSILFLCLSFSVHVAIGVDRDDAQAVDPLVHEGSQTAKTGELWGSYVEWSFSNDSYSGNPFDVVATVTFEHQGSGKTHTTEMFYADNDTWKVRFTGTRTGTWEFTTSSSDAELDGKSGTVDIVQNSDTEALGFVRMQGNKWARQKSESGALEAFVPHFRLTFDERVPLKDYTNTFVSNQLDPRMGGEGFNGVFMFMGAKWADNALASTRWSETSKRNPDPASFEALERLIQKVHSRGGVVHIWYVGDCSRDQCAQAAFGENGAETAGERRLLRYIAARLGPLPGWIMGYGYDNNEHVNTSELRSWGSYLRDHLGWPHLLGARDQNKAGEDYTFWPEADFYSRGDWFNGASYQDIRSELTSASDKVHSFDERWYKSRLGSEQAILRQLWTLNIAGGASSIVGWDGDFDINLYPHPEWFKTFFTFWEDHFQGDMRPDNSLTDGYALKDAAGENFVVYKEGTSSIQLDLSGAAGSLSAVAVDTRASYEEVDLGTLDAVSQTIQLPHSSDWVIAVGTESTVEETTGTIEVGTTTSGEDIDADGYTVSVDGTNTQSIDANGSVTFRDLATGDHELLLSDVASNCSVEGTNPRTLNVDANTAVSSTFSVSCEANVIVRADSTTTEEDQSVSISVLSNDSGSLNVTTVTPPENGSAELTTDQNIIYTPDTDFNGEDRFDYTVESSSGDTDTAPVVIGVTPVNDPPTFATEAPTAVQAGEEYLYEVKATDVDGDALSLSAPQVPNWLALTDTGDGTAHLQGTPTSSQVGTHEVKIEATDQQTSTTQAFSVEVTSDVSDSPPPPPSLPVVNRTVSKGWNLVGLPVSVGDSSRTSVFPDATPRTLFGYDGSLNQDSVLARGQGYFLHYERSNSVNINGTELSALQLTLDNGWNLISAPSCEIPVSAINDSDGIVAAGSIYGLSQGYVVADTVKPAHGYWLRATEGGQISLDCGSTATGKNTEAVADAELDGYQKLSIRDASGAHQMLFFDGAEAQPSKKSSFEMPPVPPEGIFDARFSNHRRLIDGASGTIRIQSSDYPITVELSGSAAETTYRLEERSGSEILQAHPLTSASSVKITNPAVDALVISNEAASVGETPEQFELYGNYPNPFNPQTSISFSLPEKAAVEVSIYSALGSKIMEAAAEEMSAGRQTVTIDASALSSGVYLYRVTMNTASDVRTKVGQMILVK
jgi:hypothetical protein